MKLAVIGLGEMGKYSAKALAPKVETVYINSLEPKEQIEQKIQGISNYNITETPQQAVKDADFVLFCVPTEEVYNVMLQVLPYCKKGAIISGQTSRKTPEAQAFDEYKRNHPSCGLELVTIHTMCNPKKSDPSKEILGIINHNSSRSAYEKAIQFYGNMSEHIEEFENVDEHDTMTANTQINTSRTFLSIASAFSKVRCFPWLNETYSGALDVMKFSLAMRVAFQKAHIYRGIQFGSQHGKDLTIASRKVDQELFEMIIHGEKEKYRKRIFDAKKILFPNNTKPVLSDEVMAQFGGIVIGDDDNSHYSPIHWAVDAAESGRDISGDLKATTPNYTSLLCLVDRLFNTSGALERAVAIPFEKPKIIYDDFDFHVALQEWSKALVSENTKLYNLLHAMMRENLDERLLEKQVKLSKKVTSVCRESLEKAIKEGEFIIS